MAKTDIMDDKSLNAYIYPSIRPEFERLGLDDKDLRHVKDKEHWRMYTFYKEMAGGTFMEYYVGVLPSPSSNGFYVHEYRATYGKEMVWIDGNCIGISQTFYVTDGPLPTTKEVEDFFLNHVSYRKAKKSKIIPVSRARSLKR